MAGAEAGDGAATVDDTRNPSSSGSRIDGLKRAYLSCELAAQTGRLADDTASACSGLYEALLQQGFGGSFARLHAWYLSSAASGGLSPPDH